MAVKGIFLAGSIRRQGYSRVPLLALFALAMAGASHAGDVPMRERLQTFQQVYADHIRAMDATQLTMSDETKIKVDDGVKNKSFDQKLATADIEDTLSQVYPVVGCAPSGRFPVDFDPGRIRNDNFFKAIYGKSQKDVAANLVAVDWFGQKLKVNKTLGVDKKLALVAKELAPKLASLKPYLIPSAGTFNWRPIAGTNRLSAHSYGIAIDISTAKSEYWRWAKGAPDNVSAPTNKIPEPIIAAFERQGFIWGGNWYHYDTMHFEYRPELIAIGREAQKRGCAK